MKKIAFLSTYCELCGIAYYLDVVLKKYQELYGDDSELEVLATPRNIFSTPLDKAEIVYADNFAKRLGAEASRFDHVNIQFEPGILGRDKLTAGRRLKYTTSGAKSLSITWHHLGRRDYLTKSSILKLLLSFKVISLSKVTIKNFISNSQWTRIYSYVAKQTKQKPVSHIVHTKRDELFLRALMAKYGVPDAKIFIQSTPLTYLDDKKRQEIENYAHRSKLTELRNISVHDDVKISTNAEDESAQNIRPRRRYIGVFGFFGGYKGFETAIELLSILPEDYELVFFSSVHESALEIDSRGDNYLKKLLKQIALIEQKDGTSSNKGTKSKQTKKIKSKQTDSITKYDQSRFIKRVRFMGSVSDDDLMFGMKLCDVILFPYINSVHTASGPIAQAIELGCNVMASRNTQFLELAKFHTDSIEFFDIGNTFEIAQKILHGARNIRIREQNGFTIVEPIKEYPSSFDIESAARVYHNAINYSW